MAQLLLFDSNRRRDHPATSDRVKLQALIADLQFLAVTCPIYFDLVAQITRELVERV